MIPRLRRLFTSVNAFVHLRALRCVASAKLPTNDGEFDIHVFKSVLSTKSHVALVLGAIGDGENVLTRVHSSCLTGDLFHSERCDCRRKAGTRYRSARAVRQCPQTFHRSHARRAHYGWRH